MPILKTEYNSSCSHHYHHLHHLQRLTSSSFGSHLELRLVLRCCQSGTRHGRGAWLSSWRTAPQPWKRGIRGLEVLPRNRAGAFCCRTRPGGRGGDLGQPRPHPHHPISRQPSLGLGGPLGGVLRTQRRDPQGCWPVSAGSDACQTK